MNLASWLIGVAILDTFVALIAAHAVALGVTVVTNNVEDFAKYPGVTIENWLTASAE